MPLLSLICQCEDWLIMLLPACSFTIGLCSSTGLAAFTPEAPNSLEHIGDNKKYRREIPKLEMPDHGCVFWQSLSGIPQAPSAAASSLVQLRCFAYYIFRKAPGDRESETTFARYPGTSPPLS
ncbi:hypothetical protein B0T24DRAFT_338066 [Lasiosphaeria ovina]|uniref:Secreted protein n=1 Tax=Lasiosphaeria ovina TaxID=92902 RepID=A0AAE0K9E0_9PEZI|nr:hypothetical protein B0T24DRAFT_338066 [Lasiosphaeria ovina]